MIGARTETPIARLPDALPARETAVKASDSRVGMEGGEGRRGRQAQQGGGQAYQLRHAGNLPARVPDEVPTGEESLARVHQSAL